MNYAVSKLGKEDFESSLLGFGTMKLPKIEGNNSEVDEVLGSVKDFSGMQWRIVD